MVTIFECRVVRGDPCEKLNSRTSDYDHKNNIEMPTSHNIWNEVRERVEFNKYRIVLQMGTISFAWECFVQ